MEEFDISLLPSGAKVIANFEKKSITLEIPGHSPSKTTMMEKSVKDQASPRPPSVAAVHNDFSKPNNTISLLPIEPVIPSKVESRNSGGTEGVLDTERAKATFDVKKMIDFLNGGPEMTKKKKFILGPTSKVNFDDKHTWSRTDFLKNHVKHMYEVHKVFFAKYIPSRDEVLWMTENSMLPGSLGNHYGLFLPTVMGMASAEQNGWWLTRIITMKMIGCYCQTELAHGSNVRGLRTTATYDKNTQEFILDTPTLTAMKWWPGDLGKVCTHAAVYAQLIIDGKEYGVHVFMLQVRDANHRPLPGIEIGDVGPKMGDAANDTGFLRLNNVRIPREFMFSRHQHVSKDGIYVKHTSETKNKDSDKLHYATMMFTRGTMTRQAGSYLAQACTIATRYNCIRKQGFKNTSQNVSYLTEEYPLIDYQIQAYRIFKQIAWSYALRALGTQLLARFKELTGEAELSNFVITNLDVLPEIASTTAGFKAIATQIAADGMEDLRKCCGGLGYLLSSGIAAITSDYVWRCTAEGDMIILQLQTARYMVKTIQKVRKGDPIPPGGPYSYLSVFSDHNYDFTKAAPSAASSYKKFLDLQYLEDLFRYSAICNIACSVLEVAKVVEKTGNFHKAAKDHQVELIGSVKAHCYYFVIQQFRNVISSITDQNCRLVLSRLLSLLACSLILENQWAGVIDIKILRFVKEAIAHLLTALRPDAISLVDSFDIPDRVLSSTIGSYDGNVYERVFQQALKSELNQVDPFVGYDYMRQYLDLDFLAKGNKAPKAKM